MSSGSVEVEGRGVIEKNQSRKSFSVDSLLLE